MARGSAYNASKVGVVLLTKNTAIDYGPSGIRVNVINPGFIETPMLDSVRGCVTSTSSGASGARTRSRRWRPFCYRPTIGWRIAAGPTRRGVGTYGSRSGT